MYICNGFFFLKEEGNDHFYLEKAEKEHWKLENIYS